MSCLVSSVVEKRTFVAQKCGNPESNSHQVRLDSAMNSVASEENILELTQIEATQQGISGVRFTPWFRKILPVSQRCWRLLIQWMTRDQMFGEWTK